MVADTDTGTVSVGVIPPLGVASRLQVPEHLLRALPAIGRFLLETPHYQMGQGGGNRLAVRRDGLGSLGDVRHEHHLGASSCKGRGSCEQFVGHGPEGVDVRPVIDVLRSFRLLGRHVGGCPQGHTDGRELMPSGGVAHGLGHAEVGHQSVATAEHDIVGLDVAVDHPLVVCVRQRVDHVSENPNGLADGSSPSRTIRSLSDSPSIYGRT